MMNDWGHDQIYSGRDKYYEDKIVILKKEIAKKDDTIDLLIDTVCEFGIDIMKAYKHNLGSKFDIDQHLMNREKRKNKAILDKFLSSFTKEEIEVIKTFAKKDMLI